METVVTGIAVLSALGELEDTWKRLLAGDSGIEYHQPFSELEHRSLALVEASPVNLVTLTQRIVKSAIADAQLTLPLPDCGVVIGSSRGNQARWEGAIAEGHGFKEGTHLALADWLETLPHAAAIATARQLKTAASVLAPMAACATGVWTIAQGHELIQTRQHQRVIVGAVEAPITRLTLTGFDKMGALAKTGCYPFDRDREGLVLGEGGAMLVLESAELAARRGAKIYGRVLGFGFTADGYHLSTPQPGGQAAIAAVRHCLSRSRLQPQDIDCIHAHGTATQINDRSEAHLIQQIFPPGVPLISTKGATGHTLGASGALGAAFCLMALKYQLLPPCIGLEQPEFKLNFVRTASPQPVTHALCLSFGFGGQNAAIAFGA